ncbi:CvpA family protein [Dysosmobacter sp.]|uniref:CvpA family protein n=1 Tax=Dysosmobacter sp. TaxID=2591382 RepID=UPI003A957AA8
MTTPVIIDAITVAVLGGFAIWGACRGLFRTLTELLTVVVALVGAGLIAGALAAPAARLTAPLIEEHIRQQVDDAMTVQSSQQVQMPELDVEEDEGFEIADLLALMGLDEDVRDSLVEETQEKIADTGETIAVALVESVAQSLLYGVLFLLSFLILMVLLKLAIRALDLVLKLPGLHLVNSLGGAVVGLVEGALLVFLAIWILRRLGVSFDTETVTQTHILHFFTTNTPLSALSFLR